MSRSHHRSDDGMSSPGDHDDPAPWELGKQRKEDEAEFDDDLEETDDPNDSDVDPNVIDEDSDEDSYVEGRGRSKSKSNAAVARIRRQWLAEVVEIREEHALEKATLRREIESLEARIVQLEQRGRIVFDPWIPRLHLFLERVPRQPKNGTYQAAYKALYEESCRQGIMSRSSAVHHPDLIISKRCYSERYIRRSFDRWRLNDSQYRRLCLIILPNVFSQRLPTRFLPGSAFRFEDLPRELQWRIFKLVYPTNEIIHCLSRLDPYNPPLDFTDPALPLNEAGVSVGSGYPNRFHIGKRPCCIVKAAKPNDVIGYFLVSKRWFFLGAHLFYGTNTFAFSSLGEFGRFCNGIKKARVQRLVNVEIMWRGSLMPRQDNNVSLRNITLTWLMRASRLRTLVVHINESSKNYMRRKYEMLEEVDYERDFGSLDEDPVDPFVTGSLKTQSMTQSLVENTFPVSCKRTDTQPNFRKNRNMRTLQGADNLWSLRGMKWIRFYDVDAGPTTRRTQIRDWTFAEGVNSVVTLPKCRTDALFAEVENLSAFTGLEGYEYADEDMELVKSLYDIDSNEGFGSPSISGSRQSSLSRASSSARDTSPPSSVPSSPPPARPLPPSKLQTAVDAKSESESDSKPSNLKQRKPVARKARRKANPPRKAFTLLQGPYRPSVMDRMSERVTTSLSADSDDDKYVSEPDEDKPRRRRGRASSIIDLTRDREDTDDELFVPEYDEEPKGSLRNELEKRLREQLNSDNSSSQLFVSEGSRYADTIISENTHANNMFCSEGSVSAASTSIVGDRTRDVFGDDDEGTAMDVDLKDSTSGSKSKTVVASDEMDVKTIIDVESEDSVKKESPPYVIGMPTVVSPRTLINEHHAITAMTDEGDNETIIIPSDTEDEDEADDEAGDEADEEGLVVGLAKFIKTTQEVEDLDDDSIVIPTESSSSKQQHQDVSSPSIAGYTVTSSASKRDRNYTTTTSASKRDRNANDFDKDESPSKRQKRSIEFGEQGGDDDPVSLD
ncbi:hypothetical protein F5Y18DRAFT_50756 [Xylariaceae sp. FL1019]|nr:hypothetical protein F5Y18DRAFT_50756 [Xylariaceae sp. FL1019]